MPDALKKRPEVPLYLKDYLEAYNALHKRRQIGFSAEQPLLTSEIAIHGLTHGFEEELQFFIKVISAMDDVFVQHQAEIARKKTAEMKNKSKSSPPRPSRRPPRR